MNTVVVTGAGSGVGRAVALQVRRRGLARRAGRPDGSTLAETAARAGAEAADRIGLFPCDVSAPDAAAAMGAAVLERFGDRRRARQLRRHQRAAAEFRGACPSTTGTRVLATNLHGAYYCVRAFLPGMRERRTGTIVNINSDVGKVARDLAGPAYVSSKFGLMGLTQQINAEERGNGVRACSICPRDVNTPLLDKRPQPPSPEARARMLQPEDLAACVWLVATLPSRASSTRSRCRPASA